MDNLSTAITSRAFLMIKQGFGEVRSVHEKLRELGFPMGSRVIMTGIDPTHHVKAGEIGIVCDYRKFSDGCDIGVQWEHPIPGGHDCYGKCGSGYGRYVPHSSILLVDLDLGSIEMSDQDFDFLLGINT